MVQEFVFVELLCDCVYWQTIYLQYIYCLLATKYTNRVSFQSKFFKTAFSTSWWIVNILWLEVLKMRVTSSNHVSQLGEVQNPDSFLGRKLFSLKCVFNWSDNIYSSIFYIVGRILLGLGSLTSVQWKTSGMGLTIVRLHAPERIFFKR